MLIVVILQFNIEENIIVNQSVTVQLPLSGMSGFRANSYDKVVRKI